MASTSAPTRDEFNGAPAAEVAAVIGVSNRSRRGRSSRFAYFETDESFLVVGGPQEGRDADLALAYGLTWAGGRHLMLALPAGATMATRQRLPWLRPGRVTLWEHGAGAVHEVDLLDREQSLDAARQQSPDGGASPLLHSDDAHGGSTPALRQVDALAAELGLDPAHRAGSPSWHVHGLRVLSASVSRGRTTVRAGVHRGATDRAPTTVTTDGDLGPEDLDVVRSAVAAAVSERRGGDDVPGSLHRPDEHWLQSVLRGRPELAGLAGRVHREVPAWRPTDGSAWARGFVDLLGRSPAGSVRVVETKVSSNEDTRFVLQSLDYWVWATAHREGLAAELEADPTAAVDLHMLVGAGPDGTAAVSRYSRATAEALADDIPWSFASVEGWFGGTPSATQAPPRTVPPEWSNAGRATGNAYVDAARTAAVRWKASIDPVEARRPGPYVRTPGAATYEFCLPLEHAQLNLLPEVRPRALQHFADHGIAWHRGTEVGPTTHLLSSQVQCVNALGRMMDDPERILAAFGAVLDIDEVVPLDDGSHLTFEWVPTVDVLGEGGPSGLRRGRGNTSLDAAFRYRTRAGREALALVEWKFTESYVRARPEQAAADATRTARYAHLVSAPGGPIDATVLPFEDLLDEPFYQLVRQQLFAHGVEASDQDPAAEVHVVHVLPPANTAYQASLVRESHREVGTTVADVWRRLYPAQDTDTSRYRHLDPQVFLDPAITSPEYVARYTIS